MKCATHLGGASHIKQSDVYQTFGGLVNVLARIALQKQMLYFGVVQWCAALTHKN